MRRAEKVFNARTTSGNPCRVVVPWGRVSLASSGAPLISLPCSASDLVIGKDPPLPAPDIVNDPPVHPPLGHCGLGNFYHVANFVGWLKYNREFVANLVHHG